jgi:hypothetical protein
VGRPVEFHELTKYRASFCGVCCLKLNARMGALTLSERVSSTTFRVDNVS